jgi:zinc/manganese transport system substrate-binding protein
MNMKTIFCIILISVSCLSVAPDAGAQAKRLNIVTTLNYLRAITEEIGGEHADVTALANPRQDPHYVTPTPRMNQVVRDADLFIENGLSLDLWSQNVMAASGNPAIQVGSPGHLTATINAPVKELPTEVSRSWGDIHPQGNPHIWLDPFNVKIIAGNIADKLKQLDPNNGAYYMARLEGFRNKLDREMFGEELLKAVGKSAGDILTRKAKNNELLPWLQSKHLEGKLDGWMKKAEHIKGMKVITYHKTYIYFADRFGLDLAGELEEKPGIPPPPQHRDEIVELIKRDHIKVILNDNFYSREAADYIASKTGANVVLTYIDVGSADDVRTYEQLITKLLDEIINAAK